MSKHNVVKLTGREKVCDQLTELIRSGAHKLIAQGLEAEVSELLAIFAGAVHVSHAASFSTDFSFKGTSASMCSSDVRYVTFCLSLSYQLKGWCRMQSGISVRISRTLESY